MYNANLSGAKSIVRTFLTRGRDFRHFSSRVSTTSLIELGYLHPTLHNVFTIQYFKVCANHIFNMRLQLYVWYLTTLLDHMSENQKVRYDAIVQTAVLYHLMKFQIYRFDSEGATTIHWSHFLVTWPKIEKSDMVRSCRLHKNPF